MVVGVASVLAPVPPSDVVRVFGPHASVRGVAGELLFPLCCARVIKRAECDGVVEAGGWWGEGSALSPEVLRILNTTSKLRGSEGR